MATTLTQDLDSIKAVEDKLTANQVAQFAYTQEAYNDPERYADGVQAYDVNNPNNIPVADASILKVNETVLSKGYRSQASSITRMLLNHFLGRTSYNLNKANDLIKSLVTTIKANLGQANGFATLDANGRIPYSQLPESAIEFKGAWNAQTNTPALADGTGTKGDFYVVSVAGTQNLGSGNIQFFVNDRVIYDGEVWQRLSAGDVKTVNSVQPVNGNITLTPSDIGLGNVNNTSDADKPVSTAQQEAISQAEANAENLANATGKLDVVHGGTNADNPTDARTQLGVDLELLKKANTIEGISAVDTLALTANANVFIKDFVNAIIAKVPRDVQNSIVKFVTDSTKAVNIVFDSTTPLPSGAVKISSDGLIIIGNLVKMDNNTSNLDMSLIFLDKNKTFFTCRVEQDGSHVVTASISQSQASLTFDSTPTDNSSNPVTSSGIYNAIKGAIEALDVNSVGGDGKYIEGILETDGKISASAQTMDTTPALNSNKAVTSSGIKGAIDSAVNTAEDLSNATGILSVAHGGTGTDSFDTVPTAGSNKPVTSDGIRTAIDGRLPAVVDTGDSAFPERFSYGDFKFTASGAFNFFQTENKDTWLGRVFGKFFGYFWQQQGTHDYSSLTRTTELVSLPDGSVICGTTSGIVVLSKSSKILPNKYIEDIKLVNNSILVATRNGLYVGDMIVTVPSISNGTTVKRFHITMVNFSKVNLTDVDTVRNISVLDDKVFIVTEQVTSGNLHTKVFSHPKTFSYSSDTDWTTVLNLTASGTSSTKIPPVTKNPFNGYVYFLHSVKPSTFEVNCQIYSASSENGTFSPLGSTFTPSSLTYYDRIVCSKEGTLILPGSDTLTKYADIIAIDKANLLKTVTPGLTSAIYGLKCVPLKNGQFILSADGNNAGLQLGGFNFPPYSINGFYIRGIDNADSTPDLLFRGYTIQDITPVDDDITGEKIIVLATDSNNNKQGLFRLENAQELDTSSNTTLANGGVKTLIQSTVAKKIDCVKCKHGVLVFLRLSDLDTWSIEYRPQISKYTYTECKPISLKQISSTANDNFLSMVYSHGKFVTSSATKYFTSGYEEAVQAGLIPD